MRLVLADQSFWLDEASQAMTSLRPVSEILFANLEDFHPPFSYLLTHFWIQFGRNEVWLRLLPIMFGLGTVYIGYLLMMRLFNKNTAILFGLLLAISPYHIYYSQEFRMYSMATFFAVSLMYYFVKIICDSKEKIDTVLFVLFGSLLIFTHYLGGLLFVSQLLYLYLWEKKQLVRFLKLFSYIGLIYSAWIPFLYQQLQLGLKADTILPGWSSMLSLSFLKALPLLFTKFIIGRIDFDNTLLYVSVIFVSFAVIFGAIFPLRKKINDKKIGLLLCWLWVPIILTFIISLKTPMFQPFRLLFVLPAFYMLIALGLSETKKFQRIIVSVVIGTLLIFQFIFWTQSFFWREDWKSAVGEVNHYNQNEGKTLFAWREVLPSYLFYSQKMDGIGVLERYPATLIETGSILSAIDLPNRVVVFSYLGQLTDPEQTIKKWLELHGYKLIEIKDYPGVGIVYYYVSAIQVISDQKM